MRIGRLDQRVTFSRPSTVTSPDGTHISTWEEVATVWATVTAPTSTMRFGAPMPLPVETFTVWIRYREVDASWRVTWNGNHYRITGIAYHGRRESIALTVAREDV